MMKMFAGLSSLMVAAAVVASASAVPTTSAAPSLKVVKGATQLSAQEKESVSGKCGCPTKPGYGFGTTGHYGPPGQGFEPGNNWRHHAAGDGLTPTGRPLPPRAFQ